MSTGPPLKGRKRSHDGSDMPPPTWPTSSGLAKDYSGSSPNDEDVRRNPMTSLDEQLIGNMHLSTQQEDDNDPERDWALKEPLASTNEPSSMEGWADPAMPLEAMDWEDLERRYNDAMAERDKIEDGICQEFGSLFEFFSLWMEAPIVHDNQRSTKRLKTRIHWVQNSEDDLEKKRQHYGRVVDAFKNAIALLNAPR